MRTHIQTELRIEVTCSTRTDFHCAPIQIQPPCERTWQRRWVSYLAFISGLLTNIPFLQVLYKIKYVFSLLCAACRALKCFVNNNIKHVRGLAALAHVLPSIYYNNNSDLWDFEVHSWKWLSYRYSEIESLTSNVLTLNGSVSNVNWNHSLCLWWLTCVSLFLLQIWNTPM